MSNATNKAIKKVRIFLRKISWKKILTFSFFVFIAAILWFMQIYNQLFETNVTIPIKYVSIPDSIVFNDSLPSNITVRVKDYGYNMFKYSFSKEDTIRLDVSPMMDNNGNSKVLQGASLESYIRKVMPLSALVISYDPVRISFTYSSLKSRKIPIVFDGQINLSPGYFLNGDIRILPDSITAYGSTANLDKIIYAYTTNDTVNGLESNRKINFDLVGVDNIKFVPEKVNIYVPVEAYTQKKVSIPVQCLNLPDNLNVKFFPSKVTLSFFIGVSMVDSIKINDFTVGVDYDGIKDAKSVSVPVRITSSPSFTRNLTIDPPNVEFIFEHKDSKTE